jgi:type II secretory pathway pseudopilin PulG
MKTKNKSLFIMALLFACVMLCFGLVPALTPALSPDAAIPFPGLSASLPLLFIGGGIKRMGGMSGSHLFGEKIFEWSKIMDIPMAERKEAIVGAASHFMKKVQARSLKFVGPDTNLMGVAPIAFVMSDTIKTPDRGYELIFPEYDMRASQNDHFDMMDVSGGVTFYQQLPGEEAKLSKLPSAAKTSVSMLRFTGGYAILDDWIRFNKWYLIDELTSSTIKKWFTMKAVIFYGLMVALSSGINESFATDDATTINNACAKILEDLEAAGYDVDENSEFVVTCNPKLKQRVYKALAASFLAPNTNVNQVLNNINTVVTTTKIANTSYYVSLPAGKNKRGEWDDLNLRPPQRNELVLGASHVWTGAFNGIIGEAKQHRRCALS